MRLICAGIFFVILSFNAMAQPNLLYETDEQNNNILVGANGVEILGKMYNVYFADGTCAQFHDGCDENFDFILYSNTTTEPYNEASRALAEQVLSGVAPNLISGCINSQCLVYTPYRIPKQFPSKVEASIAAVFAPNDSRFIGQTAFDANFDLGNSVSETWAVWSLANPLSRCADNIDNDGDGFIDYPNDAGCSGLEDDNEADPTLIYDSNGKVSGANNVHVLGQDLSVLFRDGTCAGLFDGCDEESDFFFPLGESANEASRALASQVLPTLEPKAIRGCGPDAVFTCWIYTPYDASALASIALLVTPDDARFVGSTLIGPHLDFFTDNIRTFAIWSTSNQPPIADAGPDQSIRAGDKVFLDGTDSFDDNTASPELLYSWSFSSVPIGSSASIAEPNTSSPSFVADLPDTYIIQLVVTDEDGQSSAPDEMAVSASNLAPTAAAGADQLVIVGKIANLDGSSSTDPESDPLSYSWSISSMPTGSNAVLLGQNGIAPTLAPDLPGSYVVDLVVSDPIGESEPDTVQITAVTAEDFSEAQIVEGSNVVVDLTLSQVTTYGNQHSLFNFLSQAVVAIQSGDIAEAVDKLQKALARTDGCVLRGSPDGNGPGRDWVTDCTAQIEIYSLLSTALAEF